MSLSNIVLLTNQFKITSSQNFQYFPLLCFSSSAPTLVTTIYFCPYFFIVSFLSLKPQYIPKSMNLWVVNFQRCGYAFHHHHAWCSLPPIYCWWLLSSSIFHLLSLLQPLTLPACPLDASPCIPAVVLDYGTFPGTVLSIIQYSVRLCFLYFCF